MNVLVRSETLGQGPYEPDEDGFALVNTRTGDRIDLGDVMLVQIDDTSLERRTTYARRVSEPGTGKAERPSAKGKARKDEKPGKDKKGRDKKEGGRRQKSFGPKKSERSKKSDKPAKKSKKDSKKPSRAARKKK